MFGSWKHYAVIFAVSLAAIAATNKVTFLRNLTGQ